MPDAAAPSTLPRPRPAPARELRGPVSDFRPTRYDSVAADRPGVRVTGVLLVAVVLIAAAAVVLPGTAGPGLGILALGIGVALSLSGLNSPTIAIELLVVLLFFRYGLKIKALPVDPYVFAFAGVLGATGVALTRRVSRAPQFGPVEGMMALFVLWAIGSAVVPHTYPVGINNPAHTFILLGISIPFVLYIVGRAVIDRERIIRALLWTILGVYAYSVMHSIAQFHAKPLAWPHTAADLSESASWAHRALGVFGNPVENGFLLVVGFMLAMFLMRSQIRPMPRFMLGALNIAALYAIYLTRTRIVYLVFGGVLIIGMLWLPRIRSYCVALLGMIGLAALASLPTLLSPDRNAGGLASTYEVQDRLNMYATAFWAIKEKPLAGWGITRFAKVNTYHHKQWAQDVPWFRGYGIKAHVNELGIAAELGLIGLLLWVIVLALVVVQLRRAIQNLPRDRDVLAGREFAILMAAFAGMWFLTGLTVDLRYLSFGNALVWLLVGVAVGAAEQASRDDTAAIAPSLATVPSLDQDEELYLQWVGAR